MPARRQTTTDRPLPLGSDIAVNGRQLPLPAKTVRHVVRRVLDLEGRQAAVSVTFLGRDSMRDLNHRFKGHARPTDVLAFALPDPDGRVVGDVYVCPWVARKEAKARGIPSREEVVRLVVHGTLHVLGYEHPEDDRSDSDMWRRQERYVRELT